MLSDGCKEFRWNANISKPDRRWVLQWAAGLSTLLAEPAAALTFPQRTLHLIIGFPPGGVGGALARIVATGLSERLGRQVIVDYMSGAGTNVSTRALLKLPADGHSLLLMGGSTVVNALLHERTQPALLQNIEPVSGLTVSAFVIAINSSASQGTLADLVAFAKANPGKVSVGTYGVGTQSHLAAQSFCKYADIEVTLVPYRGSAFMMTDLLGQHIDVAFDSVGSALPHINSGALRALAVTAAKRLTQVLTEVPAANETLPGYEILSWTGMAVRRGTQSDFIDRLHRECVMLLDDPLIRTRLSDLLLDTMPHSRSEFVEFWSRNVRHMRTLIHEIGISLE